VNHLIDLLAEIRRRPGMYIGAESITKLAAFLDGYHYAAYKLAGVSKDSLFTEFKDWIRTRFKISTSQGWANIILFYSNDESSALGRFWDLLDEFLIEKGQKPLR
jgi:hypothetical protein